MELSVSHEGGYVMARLSGVIDESAEGPFREWLHPLVRVRGTKVVLDISGSPRVNSNGISRLVLLVTDANTNGSRIVFLGATPFANEVFQVTKLDKLFEQAETLSQALEVLAVN